MKRAGKGKLPPHVLAAVEEKARLRRADERAHFWSEVEAAKTGVGGARSHGRCLPDEEKELFPNLCKDCDDDEATNAAARRLQIENAYDDIPVKVVDPFGDAGIGNGDGDGEQAVGGQSEENGNETETYGNAHATRHRHRPGTPPAYPVGQRGLVALCEELLLPPGIEPSTAICAFQKTLTTRCGFTTLTPIQRHAVPIALGQRDLVCSAQTGSGKTFAYLVPAIVGMLRRDAIGGESDVGELIDQETKEERTLPVASTSSTAPAPESTSGGYGRRRIREESAADDAADDDLIDVDTLVSLDEAVPEFEIPTNEPPTPARPRIVVLVPTRELAAQVALEARRLVFDTGYTVALLHGGQVRVAFPKSEHTVLSLTLVTVQTDYSDCLSIHRPIHAQYTTDLFRSHSQSVKPQLEQLAFGPAIVVTTPGRLLSVVADEGYLSLADVKTLIIDEADQMVDMGFAPQVFEICQGKSCLMPPPSPMVADDSWNDDQNSQGRREHSNSFDTVDKTVTTKIHRGRGRQTLLFSGKYFPITTFRRLIAHTRLTFLFLQSATFPPAVRRLALEVAIGGDPSTVPPPARVAVGRVGSTVAGIVQTLVLSTSCLREKKFPLLVDALCEGTTGPGSDTDNLTRVLVFCAGKSTAAWVRKELTRLLDADTLMCNARGVPVPKTFAAEELHGDMSQGARSRALDAFVTGACRILVATDVASRGLDLPEVSTVINFDLPTDGRDFGTYVHRIGRTGRAGRRGNAVSLYHPGFAPYEGNGFVYHALIETFLETKQEIPGWFLGLSDSNGNPHAAFGRNSASGGGKREGSFSGGPPRGRRPVRSAGGDGRGRF